MAEQPILRIAAKDFFSGIAQGAFDSKRLWYKADGITPIFDAGTGQNARTGALMAGAAGTSLSGIVDIPLALTTTFAGAVSNALLLGASGHFYFMTIDSPSVTAPTVGSDSFTDLRNGTPITNARAMLQVLDLQAGSTYAFYGQSAQIGRATLNAFTGIDTYPTGWSDNYFDSGDNVETDDVRANHRMGSSIYFGNGKYIGRIYDDGTSTPAIDARALDLPSGYRCMGLSDDGTYLVIVVCENYVRYGSVGRTRVLFWDRNTSSWAREYDLTEMYASGLQKVGNNVYAAGRFAWWRVSFGGVKRVLSRAPGIYQSQIRGNRAQSLYGEALVWAGSTESGGKAIQVLGSLDDAMPSSFFRPVNLANNEVTLVNGQVYPGYVLIGSTNSDLIAYPLAGGTPQTGLEARTVYIPLKGRYNIDRVKLKFAKPLASGDAMAVNLYGDETGSTDIPDIGKSTRSYGSATFAASGAVRAKSLASTDTGSADLVAEQLSIGLTYTTGAIQLAEVEVYGTPVGIG